MAYVKSFLLGEDGAIPNHPHFPLLVYVGAFSAGTSSAEIRKCFESNGWSNAWEDGVYPYHHFHSNSHEVLGCFAGHAEVQFGGDKGIRLTLSVGDCVVIPAGVGHKGLACSSDFQVVGAYPGGTSPDLCKGEEDLETLQDRIAQVARPGQDPVEGVKGPLLERWPAQA